MKPPKVHCFVCGKSRPAKNNVEAARAEKKRARFSCSPECRKELRRIQQAKRRGAPRSRLVPQLRLPLAA